jgi:excisionase family DNA binding protein
MGAKFENFPLAVSFLRASELTSLSRSTLRRFARDGRLKTVQLGRRRVIPMDALRDLIQNGGGEVRDEN